MSAETPSWPKYKKCSWISWAFVTISAFKAHTTASAQLQWKVVAFFVLVQKWYLYLACVVSVFVLYRYNSSCYSSLLQQVDATADAEVFFVQRATTPAAVQQQLAHYAAVWMHPDDVALLEPAQYAPNAAPAVTRKSFVLPIGPGRGMGLRSSVMGLFGSGAAPPTPG